MPDAAWPEDKLKATVIASQPQSPYPVKDKMLVKPAPHIKSHCTLRFDNYILCICEAENINSDKFCLKIGIEDEFHDPEFLILDSNVSKKNTNINKIYVFTWINDAYQNNFFSEGRIKLILTYKKWKEIIPISNSIDKDYKKLLQICLETQTQEVCANRLVLEIMRDAPNSEKISFISCLFDRLTSDRADGLTGTYFPEFDALHRRALQLDLACRNIERRGAAYVGTAQITPLVALAATVDVAATSDAEICRCISALLTCKADAEACDLALRVIQARRGARHSLAGILSALLPERTRWWVHAILLNEGLGDEQVVNGLTSLAVAAETQPLMARVLFSAALSISREAPLAALNAGWLELKLGDVSAAFRCFRSIRRHRADESLVGAWPSADTTFWPRYAFDAKGFEGLVGGRAWPRISIVVPSLNQGDFVEETLLSILNQSYPNLQLLVVDGGSTDGALDVIERYRDRIDVLIVEPDGGQSEALNKGFRRADGILLGWLNSDDMYAPGALHAAALSWLESGADIVAGICIEHDNRRLITINKPRASGPLSADRLGDIFENWFAGEFYYQPETFFTRDIINKSGLLDEELHYAMDYDLWIRMAKVGAEAEVVGWPIAFFRKHPKQKTKKFLESVCEQAAVRDRHLARRPRFERSREIDDRIGALTRSASPVVGVISKRQAKIFSCEIEAELAAYAPPGVTVVFGDSEDAPGMASADLIVALVHVQEEDAMAARLRSMRGDRAIVGWFWDNHHHLFDNYRIAKALDVVVPGHGFCGAYLRNREARMLEPLPLCVTQWSRIDVVPWFERYGAGSRSDALYGGFVDYGFAERRRNFVQEVQRRLPGAALRLIDEMRLEEYFGATEEDRFAEWCGYKTSLVLPLRDDLSQRFFDALLTGQVPLAPYEIRDFDEVIPPALQEALPVMRFSMDDPDSAVAAHAAAVAAFDRGGVEAARARHAFARDNHMFSSRIAQIVERLRAGGGQDHASHAAPSVVRSRRKLFLDAQHGLGNRMRAIASAAQIAERSGRELVIVWRPDHHCDCRFDALFDYAGAVIEADAPEAAAGRGAVVHNYMEAEPGGRKNAPVALNHDRDVYVRSAFVLNSPLTDWEGQNAFLRGLRPVEAVRALVESVKQPFDLSVHVRMEGGRKDEHLPYESPENWTARDHALIDEWRAKSHYSRFVARIDALMAEGSLDALFLAADSPEAYAAFAERYGDRLRRLQRTRYDRSAEQLRYALADAILLGRAPRMLGSTWSSFSELATRLAPGPITVEMSGTDF